MLVSQLLEARIETTGGEKLGHVHDVRVRRLQRRSSEGHELRVIGLITGSRGIRERVGFDTARNAAPIAGRDVIEWERVVEVDDENGRIVVRPEA
jgi:sporulation protein YlmC with PRC-barrel domain